MEKITVQNTSVMIISINKNDYISLTDIAKYKSDDPTAVKFRPNQRIYVQTKLCGTGIGKEFGRAETTL